jgi:hypothetical protein
MYASMMQDNFECYVYVFINLQKLKPQEKVVDSVVVLLSIIPIKVVDSVVVLLSIIPIKVVDSVVVLLSIIPIKVVDSPPL